VVLGSMLELGPGSEAIHRRVLADVLDRSVDVVVASGSFAAVAGADDRVVAAEDPLEAYARLRPRLTGDEVVLLKGSRGVALERLLPLFEADFGEGRGES
jgi:UDP-N-acetylmuramoyl-tripeptide--D-alanyl-D-alanine ligase